MIKIAHIADCHLCGSQYGYKARGADFTQGVLNAIKKAHAHSISYLICAGDLINSINPSSDTVNVSLKQISDLLIEYGICMLLTSGNHDLTSPHWAENYNAITQDEAGYSIHPGINLCDNVFLKHIDGKDGPSVLCLPFMSKVDLIAAMEKEPNADILVWHGAVQEFCGFPKPDAVTMNDFPTGKYKLIALGDIHKNSTLHREFDNLQFTYPGSTEMCSASEEAQKYIVVHTFEGGDLKGTESVPFETRKVQRFEVYDEEMMTEALQSIVPNTLLFVTASTEVAQARQRIVNILPESSILRIKFITPIDGIAVSTVTDTATLTIEDYFAKVSSDLFEDDTDLARELCTALLNPDANPSYEIDRICSKALNGQITI